MIVIDHEPNSWFLLREGDDLCLDVNCNSSFASFDVLILLSPKEETSFSRQGREAILTLVASIQLNPSKFEDRDISSLRGLDVTDTIVAWQRAGAASHTGGST
jgi:hypothetical protein